MRREPSADQLASIWLPLSVSTSCGAPPIAGTRKSFQDCPAFRLTYAICLRSGDQTGKAACSGAEVSCSRSDPLARLRQRVPSGTATYETHLPSAEKARSVAETPGITGTNFLLPRWYFTTSAAGSTPIAHIFLSPPASEAFPNDIGPLVKRTAAGALLWVPSAGSGKAQSAVRTVLVFGSFCDAWKM